MKSFDNTVENIIEIEKQYHIYLPLVSFIYDPWEHWDVVGELKKMKASLGDQRVYHITISPNMFSAQEVVSWAFDSQYLTFFSTIKNLDLKVIFRTMHEMNWGWYPWSSNPDAFQEAWRHVWRLSRDVGLDQSHILFDFSVNAWDLPAKDRNPSQTTVYEHCYPKVKDKIGCPTFEDYYPGDSYVDIVWFTFYNWGKWNSDRWRGSPDRIVNNKIRKTLSRIKQFKKPIIIDEVGTSAVQYDGPYIAQKSLDTYDHIHTFKDQWLVQLKDFLQRETAITAAVYFNVDLTNGLRRSLIWELDWAVINLARGKFYQGFWDLYTHSVLDTESVLALFWLKKIIIKTDSYFITPEVYDYIEKIEAILNTVALDKRDQVFSDLMIVHTKGWFENESFFKALQLLFSSYQSQ